MEAMLKKMDESFDFGYFKQRRDAVETLKKLPLFGLV